MPCLKYTRIHARIHARIDGSLYEVKERGGRNPLPDSEKKVTKSFKAHPRTLATVKAEAEKYGMTESAYMDMACALFRIGGLGNTNTVYT